MIEMQGAAAGRLAAPTGLSDGNSPAHPYITRKPARASNPNPFENLSLAELDRLLLESASANALGWLAEIEQALVDVQQQGAWLREELALMPPKERRHVVPLLRARIRMARSRLRYTLGELVGISMRDTELS